MWRVLAKVNVTYCFHGAASKVAAIAVHAFSLHARCEAIFSTCENLMAVKALLLAIFDENCHLQQVKKKI